MPAAWMILLALGAMGAALTLWLGGRWLASSWEVLDDDELTSKLSSQGHPQRSPVPWMRLLGWFSGGPRRLTYRRDERGRFRRTRR
jgi:hypothetical protein